MSNQPSTTHLEQIKSALAELKEAREKATPNGWEWEKSNYFDGMGLTRRRWVTCMVSDENNHHEDTDGGKEVDANLNFISLSSAQWLNLLRVIETQTETLSNISRDSVWCDVCGASDMADTALEQAAAILSGGRK